MQRVGAGRRYFIHFLPALLACLPAFLFMSGDMLVLFFVLAHRPSFRSSLNVSIPEPLRPEAVKSLMSLSPKDAAGRATPGSAVIGWKVDDDQRAELLQQFPPVYPNVVADHVTLAARVDQRSTLPAETVGEIIGRADDGKGVEALIVSISGTTDRPDGSTYHITWSLAEGRRARESNNVIATLGWAKVDLPVPVTLHPAAFS